VTFLAILRQTHEKRQPVFSRVEAARFLRRRHPPQRAANRKRSPALCSRNQRRPYSRRAVRARRGKRLFGMTIGRLAGPSKKLKVFGLIRAVIGERDEPSPAHGGANAYRPDERDDTASAQERFAARCRQADRRRGRSAADRGTARSAAAWAAPSVSPACRSSTVADWPV
jgi:hypothetical protein